VIEWLNRLVRRPALSVPALLAIGFAIPWLTLGIVAVASDIGFSVEVTKYRWWLILISLSLGVLAVALYLYWFLYYHFAAERSEVKRLIKENTDLREQKESIFRLMKRYEAEAQESIFERLSALALSSLMESEWKKKGARVERCRVERAPQDDKDDLPNADSLYRVRVLINLGQHDGVIIGMRFFVQDPTDLKKYGTIVVDDCYEKGSTCSIVQIDHQGFWAEVIDALQSPNDSQIIQAAPNVLVSTSPFKELSEESATELLDWLQKLETVKL